MFKRSLIEFFDSLIRTLAVTELLYKDPDLMENIQCWVVSMSSAAHRAFRHTATVVSLAIMDGLCEVGKKLVTEEARLQRQLEGEQKKKRVNQGRVKDLAEKIKLESEQRATLNDILKDWSDTVFVHRYRDVNPKIRVDCVLHLGNWILLYPDQFFDGQHLRYLGWLLSDPSPQTRHQVLKELQKLYKDRAKLAGLQQFTERFRPRMIEMATQDADPTVRVAAIEAINCLRDSGLLEPDDIDTVGRLIYDAEIRVRRAVVPFFSASVGDSYDDKVTELGGVDTVEEGLPEVGDDDEYEGIRKEWLRLKALAELLRSFDPDESPSRDERNDVLIASETESRFSMAAQAFLPQMPELKDWKLLAGYLLFDNTQAVNETGSDTLSQIKQLCVLDEKEEALLLDVLNESVKASVIELMEEAKSGRMSKKQKQSLQNEQENIAQSLAGLIPKLLSRFGAVPTAASAVLRLQRLLNLDVFQELRQDSTTYAALLDDVKKQFMSHKTKDVVSEASNALLHARSFQGLEEITDEHLRGIWDDTAYALIEHCLGEELGSRGAIETPTLIAISSTVLRIASLARVSDCVAALEAPQTYVSAKRRRKSSGVAPQLPINLLLDMLGRGRSASRLEPEVNALEDELVSNVISALLCYFFWQAKSLQSEVATEEALENLRDRRDTFASKLLWIVVHCHGVDKLRIAAAEALLDLRTVFTVNINAGTSGTIPTLLSEALTPDEQTALLNVFAAAEQDFAKISGKKLEEPAEDEEPEDLSDSESEDGSDDGHTTEKQRELLFSEDRLCNLTGKFVLAIISGVADPLGPKSPAASASWVGPVRKRVCRNKARLGPNFKEVLAALDTPLARAKRSKNKTTHATQHTKSAQVVIEDDQDDDPMDDEDDNDVEDLRRRGLAVDAELFGRDLEADAGEAEPESAPESVVGD